MTIRITTLPNGLRVATDRMDSVETASVGVWIGVGTRQEAPDVNGVAHLLEHMAFKGTERRSAREIAEEIEAVGGSMNAQTSREQTAYFVKVLKGDLRLAVDILADILLHSIYDPTELARERAVILQELGQAEDTPDDVIFDRFQEAAFPGQALGFPVLGKAEIIDKLPREALVDFRTRHYGASAMVVAAAGNLDHDELVSLTRRAFAALPEAGDTSYEAARYVGGEHRDDQDLEQVHLALGFPGVSFADPDYYASMVLATLLGGGMSSRLFQEIREQRGLAYGVSAYAAPYLDGGVFGVYAGTGEKETPELVEVLFEQLAAVRDPVPENELQRARTQMRAGILMSLESTGARMEALGSQLLIYGRPIPVEEMVRKINAVGAGDVAQVAHRIFSGRPTLAAMGPLGGLESYEKLVRRLV
ncbi:MAG TPA: pitrilysin family protein [Alphaproteobacteria bacterium]